MTTRRPKYSKEEFARRADAIYDREVAPQATADQMGQFVAIDIESGDYEIAADEHTAVRRLEERVPHAQMWLQRVGSRFLYRFGGGRVKS
jgi:hypothetical protein